MNVLLIMTLTSFGDWGYHGFVGEPSVPPPAPPAIRRSDPVTRVEPIAPPSKTEAQASVPPAPISPPASAPAIASPSPESKNPPAATPAQPPPLQRWRLADATGQVWEFHDPVKLKEWVQARNAPPSPKAPSQTFSAPASFPNFGAPPMFFGGSSCASGQCYGR